MSTPFLQAVLRALSTRPGYTFLSVGVLALGFTSLLLIGLWVGDELRYDAFHQNADRTYRVVREFDLPTLQGGFPYTPPALGPTLAQTAPGVAMSVRTGRQGGVVSTGEQAHVEPDIFYADPGFFAMFDFEVIRGEARLERPGTVLLTPAMVEKYVPTGDPVGQRLTVREQEVEVTGVVAPAPPHSSLQYDFVASLRGEPFADDTRWLGNNFQTFVLLAPDAAPPALDKPFAAIIRNHIAPQYEQTFSRAYTPGAHAFHLQPLTDVHLGGGVPVAIPSSGDATMVALFTVLGLFILVLAGANFAGLVTARSTQRIREVGVRKALGANRRQVALQFLGESVLAAIGALGVAVVLGRILLPAFNALAGKALSLAVLAQGPVLAAVLVAALVVGLAAGAYPAVVASRYSPAEVLRGSTGLVHGSRVRRGLVVVQFVVSIVLLAGTGVVDRQLSFMRSADLGFDPDGVIVIDNLSALDGRAEAFKEAVRQHSSVAAVASGFAVPGTFHINSMWRSGEPGAEDENLNYAFVSPGYLEAIEVVLAAGRRFDPDRVADSTAVLLNRAGAEAFGWSPHQAVGRTIQSGAEAQTKHTVIGVVDDYHYESLHRRIQPLALFAERRTWHRQRAVVRSVPGREADALKATREVWSEVSALAFAPSFLDRDLDAQYRAEARTERIVQAGALLTVVIACLGLFGLAAFTVESRRKEIGLRKAVGASVASVVRMVTADMLRLLALAAAIGLPLAYAGMRVWLRDFAYQVPLGPTAFVVAALTATAAGLIAVLYHAARAARIDPATTLRADG
jgi:putative ABC transport system permease protein